MSAVLYIRNTRPNAVLIRYVVGDKTMKYTVERRGSREDTTVLPLEAKDDPVVAGLINRGIIEEISKEAFYALDARKEGRPAYALAKKGEQVNLPISPEDSRTPMVIADKTLDDSKFLRTPRPEFAERVPSTSEELATGIRQPLPELKKAISSLESKEEKLETQVADLTTQVQQLANLLEQQMKQQYESQAQAVPTEVSTPRKRPATGTKTTRAKKRS